MTFIINVNQYNKYTGKEKNILKIDDSKYDYAVNLE